jgi:hypothetical protein
MIRVTVKLSKRRRVVLHTVGGIEVQQKVPGKAWCVDRMAARRLTDELAEARALLNFTIIKLKGITRNELTQAQPAAHRVFAGDPILT